ncbi:transcriptional regulator [Paramagnetospirillum kuznetsovii]|uniref:Transcriptional regulator n=1 Tax=Paramagnetospirillum kuznetsovii TaxID=2053833 RepID=A0A364NU37_9PROT|nr:fused response regulator/phosphatase [Paramagnetospirillum kuznetsovii]RAU20584.1 transcriptional regulator [Paramagnetospirillum kuznetsovii]
MTLDEARVLIVDDNIGNQEVLSAIVQSIGVTRIETALNGVEGLEAVRRDKPDIVLLDVLMPVMDGYEMCRRLRMEYSRDELPVLFVTAFDNPDSRTNCFAAGGTDMVTKPINAAEVMARLNVHLENRILVTGLKAYQSRMTEELELARDTQETLHPHPSQLTDIEARRAIRVTGIIETSSELGGDFWTVFETHDNNLGLLVADFTGHGVAAAFNTVRLHALMARRPWALRGPGELLEFLNHELKQLLPPGQFAAALACELNAASGTLTCAGGLTPQPVLIEANGAARFLPVSGPPLGAFIDASYGEITLSMEPGAALLAYSDALLESMVDDKVAVTEDELLAWSAEIGPGGDLVKGVLSRFHDRLPGQPPDDLTIVAMQRR